MFYFHVTVVYILIFFTEDYGYFDTEIFEFLYYLLLLFDYKFLFYLIVFLFSVSNFISCLNNFDVLGENDQKVAIYYNFHVQNVFLAMSIFNG